MLRYWVITLEVLLLVGGGCYAQNSDGPSVALSLVKTRMAWENVDNPLNVVAERLKCEAVGVTTSNGRLDRYDTASCVWQYRPEKAGNAVIYVWRVANGQKELLDEVGLKVKQISYGPARIGGMMHGTMPASTMRLQMAPSANIDDFDLSERVCIHKFRMRIVLNGEIIFDRRYYDWHGARLDSDVTRNLRPGHVVWLTDVYGHNRSGQLIKLNEIDLVLN